ncbi:methyltransferase domain-containing protein [Streptomyces polyrhachis]|uniref:Methyltransferase domain-containing protein n=1 Tax=Streptomyces polyrhachis TaxID=1282885 RepID=A0ABW2GFA4_9ACTN
MTVVSRPPALVRTHPSAAHAPSPAPRPAAGSSRARDWAEIQERMMVPLYEAVYDRLDLGPGARLLGLGCGSGLALLLAARRGAQVTGLDSDPRRLALARERLTAGSGREASHRAALPGRGLPDLPGERGRPFTVITAFERVRASTLAEAAALAERGSAVVLASWGPAERCASTPVLRLGARLADPAGAPAAWRAPGRDDLEDLARAAGLTPAGSGRVACPFGYADTDSAVRGLLSTGYFDAAIRALDEARVVKELTEALHPYRREGGMVWMPNVFRYLIASA